MEDTDFFSNYECMRNDKSQKRFMEALDAIRATIDATKGYNPGEENPPRTGLEYFAAISSMIDHRIKSGELTGIPELLRLLNVCLGSLKVIDSTIASRLIEDLVPLLDQENKELLIQLCPVISTLMSSTSTIDEVQKKVSHYLCRASLSDDSRLRKNANNAIYGAHGIKSRCFKYLYKHIAEDPLRTLTVIKNLVFSDVVKDWTPYISTFIDLAENSNRAARVKAIEILSKAVCDLPPETVAGIARKFAADPHATSPDICGAVVQLVQSCFARLSHDAPTFLTANFVEIAHDLFRLLNAPDEAAQGVRRVLMYGVQVISKTDPEVLKQFIVELDSALTVQNVNIWPAIMEVLGLVAEHCEDPMEALRDPIVSTLMKLSRGDIRNSGSIITFANVIMQRAGLARFWSETGVQQKLDEIFGPEPADAIGILDSVVIPILQSYKSKDTTDLAWTVDYLMRIEETLMNYKDENLQKEGTALPVKAVWGRLWNVIPNCVNTDVEDAYQFAAVCFQRFREFPELRRSIAKVLANIGRCANILDQILYFVTGPQEDNHAISLLVPAIGKMAPHDQMAVQSHFADITRAIFHDEMIEINAKIPSGMKENEVQALIAHKKLTVQRAFIDVTVELYPSLDEKSRSDLVALFKKYASMSNDMQKKALKALKSIYVFDHDSQLRDDLKQMLQATLDSTASSAVRYRILLMTTLIQTATDDLRPLLVEYLPSIVEAMKDSGLKTRAAAQDSINSLGEEFIRRTNSVKELIQALVMILASNAPTLISGSIDAMIGLITRFNRSIDSRLMLQLCQTVFLLVNDEQPSKVLRSLVSFAKLVLHKMPKFAERTQLEPIVRLGICCIQKKNWDIQNKGEKLIEECIEQCGVKQVEPLFPKELQHVFRNLRKSNSRKNRQTADHNDSSEDDGIAFDERFDTEVIDLLDSAQALQHPAFQDDSEDENLDIKEDGRLVLIEPKKAIKKAAMKAAGSDDEDEETDKATIKKMNNNRQKKEMFVQKRGGNSKGTTQVFAPLDPKLVNKRNRSKLKAEYKKFFAKHK